MAETCFCRTRLNRFKQRFKPPLAETCQTCVIVIYYIKFWCFLICLQAVAETYGRNLFLPHRFKPPLAETCQPWFKVIQLGKIAFALRYVCNMTVGQLTVKYYNTIYFFMTVFKNDN